MGGMQRSGVEMVSRVSGVEWSGVERGGAGSGGSYSIS